MVALTGSDTASRPARALSTARCMTLAPCPRSVSASVASGDTSTPSCCISAVLPNASDCAPTTPCTPMPDSESNCSGLFSTNPCCFAAATMAAASGCSLPWSRLAARRNTSLSENPPKPSARSKVGRPSVRVPVLSTISVSTLRRFSMAAASRNRMPLLAPRPVATMIDIGVARPSAQGQAMISTATALIRA